MSDPQRTITKEQSDRLARNSLIYTYALVALFVWCATHSVSWTIVSVLVRNFISDGLTIFGVHEKWRALVNRLFRGTGEHP